MIALIEIGIGTILIVIALLNDITLMVPICGIVTLFLGLYRLVDSAIASYSKKEVK